MSEYIGSRISLVSRSDIRYVGTLHEINSETSTVALENVSSFGTEGRKGNPDEEIPPSDNVYEYIVFRGSDVKDLRIEEAPAVKENLPPQMPNDPAILGSGSRPSQSHPAAGYPTQQPQTIQQQASQQHAPPAPNQPQQAVPVQGGQQFQQQQYPPHYYGPPPGQWGRGGPPPGPGYPGMPPPGWYPPPGQGFPQPGPFPYGPYGPYPPVPPTGPGQQLPPPGSQTTKPAPIGPSGSKQQPPSRPAADKAVEPKSLSKPPAPAAAAVPRKAVTPPSELPASTDVQKEVEAAPSKPTAPQTAASTSGKPPPTGPKNGRIMPAVPLQSPAPPKAALPANVGDVTKPPVTQPTTVRSPVDDATRAATAAVAAAMAKLPPVGGQQTNGTAMDNLTRKVNEMRTNEPIRAPRHPGTAGFGGQRAHGRGGGRQETRKIDVPTTDFDFEESNAKFNKQELMKETIAGSPLTEQLANGSTTEDGGAEGGIAAPTSYNKKTSFFDDLSSELKDRTDNPGNRPGGREWRGEEQKRNVETFGQGSVDNGYRGGYRGRGRGRGAMRGRGYSNNGQPGTRGRSGYRGSRGESQTVAQ